jgi:glycosyl transferase-like sugar-binding protein
LAVRRAQRGDRRITVWGGLVSETFQSLWVGGELSPLEQVSIASFLAHGYSYHLYTYEDVASVPKGADIRDANQILPASAIFAYRLGTHAGSLAAFADWFRYRLLAERGGWWVDTDVVCLRPFTLNRPVVLASERTRSGGWLVTPMLMRLPPGHRLLEQCCREAERIDKPSIQWGAIGPPMFDRVVRSLKLEEWICPPDYFAPLDWWHAAALLEPEGYSPPQESFALHLWNERWRVENLDKTGLHSPLSAYERLKDRYLT